MTRNERMKTKMKERDDEDEGFLAVDGGNRDGVWAASREEDAVGFGFELAMEFKEESTSDAPIRKNPPPVTDRVKNPILGSRRRSALDMNVLKCGESLDCSFLRYFQSV